MKTIQDRVLERIEEMAREKGLEPTSAPAWSNTGRIIFTAVGGFEPLCNLAYSFQDAYATFAWRTDGVEANYFDINAGATKIDHVTYAKMGEIEGFLKALGASLPAQAIEVGSESAPSIG
jgi:hypothetical protein